MKKRKPASAGHPMGARRRLGQNKRANWILVGVLFPLLSGVIGYSVFEDLTSIPPDPAPPAASVLEIAPPPEVFGEKVDYVTQHNDTLEQLFRRHDLSLDDLATILQAPNAAQHLAQINAGDIITVVQDNGDIQALSRHISDTETLSVTRNRSGYSAEIRTTPIEIVAAHAHGIINSSLFAAARSAGLGPETALRLANEIFGWQIDFAFDIRAGDRFSVIYERKFRDGKYLGDGRILAAKFVNGGEIYRAVYYSSSDGAINDYFSPEGHSVRRQFLRAPLHFTRVSSNFSSARLHPIFNTIEAHRGVDYAAPYGTPIKAAGDGRVRFAGTSGDYGKVVILDHGLKVSTLYAHMSRFSPKLFEGKRVKQGEIIGYVGSSGASTGPHVHYEYRVKGVHKNPRTAPLVTAMAIPAQYHADFHWQSDALLAELERIETSLVAALPRK